MWFTDDTRILDSVHSYQLNNPGSSAGRAKWRINLSTSAEQTNLAHLALHMHMLCSLTPLPHTM